MTMHKLETWYDLKRFINDELTGDHLGQRIELLADGELVIIDNVSKATDGDLTLEGSFFD